MAAIRFYEKRNPYYEFSNFYEKAPFELDGHVWPTVEHYFQSAKFPHVPEYQTYIRQCSTPNKAFQLGRQKSGSGYQQKWQIHTSQCPEYINDVIARFSNYTPREDWEIVKETILEKALVAKFTQHSKLRTLLLETGDVDIIEDSPRDAYWGIGRDGTGLNRLGKLLVNVRTKLNASATPLSFL